MTKVEKPVPRGCDMPRPPISRVPPVVSVALLAGSEKEGATVEAVRGMDCAWSSPTLEGDSKNSRRGYADQARIATSACELLTRRLSREP